MNDNMNLIDPKSNQWLELTDRGYDLSFAHKVGASNFQAEGIIIYYYIDIDSCLAIIQEENSKRIWGIPIPFMFTAIEHSVLSQLNPAIQGNIAGSDKLN